MPPKKDKPKEKPAGWSFDIVEGFILLLFLMAILGSVVPMLWSYLTSGEFSFFGYKLSGIYYFFKNNIQFFKAFGFAVAGLSAVGTFTFTKKADAIWRVEKAKMYPENMEVVTFDASLGKNPLTEKWEKIIKLSESTNQSDWRLAVIESDIILDDLLGKLQLPGETMGEKLKAVEPSDFTTIESAWEAHKFRNMIAHEGSDFIINQREIRRIILLYESVFKEFQLI
ncbi:MAG: hypothetical protein WC657_05330 [Candidatus Paceibacterota bacterium]|jgi:hypothetical protein